MKVLVIDDSDVALNFTAGVLRGAGMEVVTLSSPLGGAQAMIHHNPDIVLLDIDMPALSGEKATTILKRQRWLKQVIIVLYSDRPVAELEKAVKRCGADGFICKTQKQDLLIEQVKKLAAQS